MTDEQIARLEKLGGLLIAAGERLYISYRPHDVQPFSVGIGLANALTADCYGHSDSLAHAYLQAAAKLDESRREMEIRARVAAEIERAVRAEMAVSE